MQQLGIILIVIVLIFACGGLAISVNQTAAQIETVSAEYEADVWESRQAVAEARADQLRAEGDLAESQASADVQRALGDVAARAVERQGKLLTMYIVGGQVRSFGSGLFVGALVVTAIFLLAPRVSVELKKRDLEY